MCFWQGMDLFSRTPSGAKGILVMTDSPHRGGDAAREAIMTSTIAFSPSLWFSGFQVR
jgi:hypothetical protein